MEKEALSIIIVKTLLAVVIFAGLGTIIIGGGYLIGKYTITPPNNKDNVKELLDEWKVCDQDSDCIGTRLDCSCYTKDAINKAYLNDWINILRERCQSDKCMMDLRLRFNSRNIINKAVCENNRCEIRQEKEKEVIITTDKTEYEQGEMVEITVRNNLNEPIYYIAGLSYCESKPYNTYQFSPEKEKWIDIFTYAPICAEFVGAGLPIYKELAPSGSIEFIWNQMIWNSTGNNIQTPSGKYKNSIKYKKSKKAKNLETIYSNEFTIKEKSAFDLKCSEKVKIVGSCDAEMQGYEFNLDTGKCIVVNNSGCSIETSFKTLEECREVCEKKENVVLPDEDELIKCSNDSDCVLVNSNCCSCNMGGAMICINKKYLENWNRRLSCQDEINRMCPAVYLCDDNPTGCECINNVCQGTEGGLTKL